MPRIRCHYIDCVFIDDGFCNAVTIEIDPDMGCTTFSRLVEEEDEDEWSDDDDMEEWDEEEEEDDLWFDDDY